METPHGNGRIRVPTIAIWIVVVVVGWAISAYVGYAAATNSMNARVSVLESQFQQLHQDIAEVKSDVKALLRRP